MAFHDAERLKEAFGLCVKKGGDGMNYPTLRHGFVFASVLLLSGFTVGCTTVVTPISTSDSVSMDESYGLVFGNIRLAWYGTDQPERLEQPLTMKWSIEEETRGERFLIGDLPTQGPFVLRLPAGSYRLNSISFDSIGGKWHTVLPTTLQVQSGGCTSLGTWELERETESFAGWITGHVVKDLEPTQAELQQMSPIKDCPTLADLESPVRSKLGFQNRGSGQF
jgi:hypothetical protein